MSTGPVGISDAIDHTDANLVRRLCDASGTLIRPSAPLRAIDATYFAVPDDTLEDAAVSSNGPPPWKPRGPPSGYVWSTHSAIPVAGPDAGQSTVFLWHILIAFNVTEHWNMMRADTLPPISEMPGCLVLWRYWDGGAGCQNGTLAAPSGCIMQWPADDHGHPGSPGANEVPDAWTGPMAANGTMAHVQVDTFVALPGGWVFLGDLTKAVVVSPDRFPNITVEAAASGTSSRLRAAVMGGPREAVDVTAVNADGIVMVQTVVLDGLGKGVAAFQ